MGYGGGMTTRSDFLAAGAVAALATGAAGAAGAAPASAADNAVLDEAAFVARIRSTAKHRQLIAAPRVDDGAPLQFVINTLNGFKTAWHESDANVQIALVLYGSAVTIGLDDEAWRTYKLAEIVKKVQQEFLTVDASQANPWAHSAAGRGGDRSVAALIGRGVRIILCNTALGDMANRIVAASYNSGDDAFAVQAKLRARALPGTDIVPAGISSVAVLQENGYSFFSAAL
jgi:intracellular sulfur oxidation DsrE/DsrF family protein